MTAEDGRDLGTGAVTITAKSFYAGSDPATGEEFQIDEGESREISKEKADQLKADFPDQFDFGGQRAAKEEAAKGEIGKKAGSRKKAAG